MKSKKIEQLKCAHTHQFTAAQIEKGAILNSAFYFTL